jgi:hypothetical protein
MEEPQKPLEEQSAQVGPKVDGRNRLAEEIFSYQVSKDQKVFLFWNGKQVKILKGQEAQKFLKRIAGLAPYQTQLVMAKVTGNFKRGNER